MGESYYSWIFNLLRNLHTFPIVVIPTYIGIKVNNGEGNGTPLQYACLENPMDGGAWWAVVYGV